MADLHGKRYVMIINPTSGSAAGVHQVTALARALRRAGASLGVEITQSVDHAQCVLQAARVDKPDAIIVVGGDGTVRSALAALAGAGIAILVIPGGTENLLATQYGLDGTCDQAMDLLQNAGGMTMDLATVNDTWFMAIMGLGFDAEVIDRMARMRRGHISHLDYAWPIMRTFGAYRFPRFRVVADGVECSCGAAMIFVSNIPRYAMGLGIAPQARPDDGLLDLTILHTDNHLDLLRQTAGIVLNRPVAGATVYRGTYRSVRIESLDGDEPCQVDGDPGPGGPWEIAVQPAAVKLLVPTNITPPGPLHYIKRWL